MKPSDDVWKDITSLSSPTTNHFQNFFQPATLRQPPLSTSSTAAHFFPPPPPTTPTMLTLLTPTLDEDPCKRHKPNPPPPPQPPTHSFMQPETSSPEYSEKFRRLMKNRESAARSRARKQARADELEVEVMRLAKENAKLKKMQKEASLSHVAKESRLHRTKSAPF
uniref:bZIP transcription factor 27-like isoform X2 n=1 Tax=Erigeron canadensis TaxID=72917 RepID=UPI001CB96D8B|nr:bZIP transcription factor 27-like isoform X2 [Erigeron canadensis]